MREEPLLIDNGREYSEQGSFNMIGGEVHQTAQNIGSVLHSDWQENYRKEKPEVTERIKKTNDLRWQELNNSTEVDILNTDFKDLPLDWQGENKDAGDLATALVDEKNKNGEKIDIEELASIVHNEWMKRNPIQSWTSEKEKALHINYSDLPESEKQKDRDQLITAIDALKV